MKKSIYSCDPKHLAELLGTFGLTLAVSVSLASGLPEAGALIAALTLGVFVYTIGPISGCHINPAVTIGLWSIKKISGDQAVRYVVAQFIGAALAMAVASFLTGSSPAPYVEDALVVGLAELIGTAFLVFGISAVAYKKVSQGASGVTIGGSLLIGAFIASTVSNGMLNPAVAFGVSSFSLMYVIGPVAGGIAGAWLYRTVAG